MENTEELLNMIGERCVKDGDSLAVVGLVQMARIQEMRFVSQEKQIDHLHHRIMALEAQNGAIKSITARLAALEAQAAQPKPAQALSVSDGEIDALLGDLHNEIGAFGSSIHYALPLHYETARVVMRRVVADWLAGVLKENAK